MRALLLTFPGARADLVEPYLVDGTMRYLALLASNGVVAEYMVGVDPPAPAVSHISLATGSRPRATGIVGERFRRLGQPLEPASQAADAPSNVPPIWAWDPRQDQPDALLFWPAAGVADSAPLALQLSAPLAAPASLRVDLGATPWPTNTLPASFSPPRAGRAPIKDDRGQTLAVLAVALIDSSNDDIVGYNSVELALLDPQESRPPAFQSAAHGAWTVLALPGRPTAGIAFKVGRLDSTTLTIEQSAAIELTSRPAELAGEVVSHLGPPVPAPERAGLQPADYLALAGRRLQWQAATIGYVQERYAPRLTLASLDVIGLASSVAIPATPIDPYEPRLRSVYQMADQALGRLLAGLDLSRATIVIGSPYGYAGADVAVNVSALLDKLAPPAGGRRLFAVYSSGGMAHIVLNLVDREPAGSIGPGEYNRLLIELSKRLSEFTLDGRPVFERVLAGDERRPIGLDSPNSGDIIVQAAPGVLLVESDPGGQKRLSWPVKEAATGYSARQPAMRGFLVMAGPPVAARGLVEPVELVDVAPTLAEILGMHIPPAVEGRPLRELLRAADR